MTDKNADNCCAGASDCCSPGGIGQIINLPIRRKMTVDFLFLDLSVCTR